VLPYLREPVLRTIRLNREKNREKFPDKSLEPVLDIQLKIGLHSQNNEGN
jgi:hypothetical protein